ncbi:ABC transporter permease [uncultured Winogradskyella sp.]|uniref:ABC transporter permease n=1 Tax=uncultured Winogradskyella sp. TaxID=395353 RepID=UPI0026214477|nr:ABC transporter permease [uncultured Winogradskyella sp.]
MDFAIHLYILLAFRVLIKLIGKQKNDFLKFLLTKKNYILTKLIENFIGILPFVFFLTYKKLFLYIPIFIALAITSIFFNFNRGFNFTIPTPFYKKPFEFTIGFRNTFYIFPIVYYLLYISVSVKNFNLSVFSMLMIFLVVSSYYSKLENEYFIWNYKTSPEEFIHKKIKTGLTYTTLLSSPIFIVIGINFTAEFETLLIFWLLANAYLTTIILAKYAAYPFQTDLPQWVFIGISIAFPPLLIIQIPYFYFQSRKKLNTILE